MPEETNAAPLGPSLTPEAVGGDDEEAVFDEAAREKLLRPRACPPTPAAAAMVVLREPSSAVGCDRVGPYGVPRAGAV
jgi:hypothetical protein